MIVKLGNRFSLLIIVVLISLFVRFVYFGDEWILNFTTNDNLSKLCIRLSSESDCRALIIFSNLQNGFVDEIVKTRFSVGQMHNAKIAFQDSGVFSPGRIKIIVAGHQIDIMKRAIIIDDKEYSWGNGQVIELYF